MNEPIYVTKPFLPPLAEYVPLLEEIWASGILTNSGPFHQRLERELGEFLDAPALSLTANGALALELAIEASELSGEVITTPYSFAATAHSALRCRLEPVFVDISPVDFNIDPAAVERAITPRTSAIVAVHCYGNPCDVRALQRIADERGLKIIYDAAHAFGVRLHGESVFQWGDYSALSFHATKSYNTFEGGAVISASLEAKAGIDRLKNFGIASETEIPVTGTNAKMSELNAAFGCLQLRYYEQVRSARRRVDETYREMLKDVSGIDVPPIPNGVSANYSYFPILIDESFPLRRDEVYEALKSRRIFSRRYFYPLLSNLPMYGRYASASVENLPISNDIASRILCLPIYPQLEENQVERIVSELHNMSNL